jgi:hypothetical protein
MFTYQLNQEIEEIAPPFALILRYVFAKQKHSGCTVVSKGTAGCTKEKNRNNEEKYTYLPLRSP